MEGTAGDMVMTGDDLVILHNTTWRAVAQVRSQRPVLDITRAPEFRHPPLKGWPVWKRDDGLPPVGRAPGWRVRPVAAVRALQPPGNPRR
jgi:hypothetical protein